MCLFACLALCCCLMPAIVICVRLDSSPIPLAGNYKVAHDFLFDFHRELTERHCDMPQNMTRILRLLHSYVIARVTRHVPRRA